MPSISMFYGIVIYMYFKNNRQHNKPHIHARYQVFFACPFSPLSGWSHKLLEDDEEMGKK